jgi:hypothetical protein
LCRYATHNMHHSFTNIDGRDGDIKLEPLYYLSDPAVTGRKDNKAGGCTSYRTVVQNGRPERL